MLRSLPQTRNLVCFGKQHPQILKKNIWSPWLKDTVATDWIHRCSLVFSASPCFFLHRPLCDSSHGWRALIGRCVCPSGWPCWLRRCSCWTSCGPSHHSGDWWNKHIQSYFIHSFFWTDGQTDGPMDGGRTCVWAAELAGRWLGLLLWSDLRSPSAPPPAGRSPPESSASSRAAPPLPTQGYGITGITLKWPLFFLCIWRPDFLQFHGISLLL